MVTQLDFPALSILSFVVSVCWVEYLPNRTDDCQLIKMIVSFTDPQIPESTQTATWPICDVGPGPRVKTPFGKNQSQSTPAPRGPKGTRRMGRHRDPQRKQVRLGETPQTTSSIVTSKMLPVFLKKTVSYVSSNFYEVPPIFCTT